MLLAELRQGDAGLRPLLLAGRAAGGERLLLGGQGGDGGEFLCLAAGEVVDLGAEGVALGGGFGPEAGYLGQFARDDGRLGPQGLGRLGQASLAASTSTLAMEAS
jgi:hypothetical protein